MESTTTRREGAKGTHAFLLGGDLPIDRLAFGAMRLPTAGFHGPPRDAELGRAVLRRALELGVSHIDTAAFYRSGDGSVHANTLIRDALHPYARELSIATKVGPLWGPSGPTPASPAELRALVEENLTMLGLDRLDVVYLRVGAMTVPHGESIAARFEALAALREEGLIRHLGLSNVDSAHLREARAIAPVVIVQNNFHVAKRDEADVLRACEADGIAFAPYFPLGGGMVDIGNERVARVAARHEASVSQIALAWLLALSPVTVAIPGTGSLAHLEENMAARSIVLSSDDLADLGQA